MGNNSSLKSITDKAGVSITTVHRALTGKKDYSAQTREKILAIASEEGYEFNYYAASLRRKKLHIAVIIGSKTSDSRFFADKYRYGIEQCIDANSQFNIDYRFIQYSAKDLEAPNSSRIVASLKKENFDGVLMRVLKFPQRDLAKLSEILSSGIPVVALELNPTSRKDICTISVDNDVADRMAGELIAKIAHASGKVFIFSQEMSLRDRNAEEARKEILSLRNDLDVIEIPLPLTGDESIYATLGSMNQLAGVPERIKMLAGLWLALGAILVFICFLFIYNISDDEMKRISDSLHKMSEEAEKKILEEEK